MVTLADYIPRNRTKINDYLSIILIGDTMEDSVYELNKLFNENFSEIYPFDKHFFKATTKDGICIKCFSKDEILHSFPCLNLKNTQFFITKRASRCSMLIKKLQRFYSISSIPEDYLIQILED